jgi:hypothetical protein
MTGGERPRLFGAEEDRRLLDRAAAAATVVPERLRLETRRALETRIFSPGRFRGLGLGLAVALLGGSALAYGLVAGRGAPTEQPSGPEPLAPRAGPPALSPPVLEAPLPERPARRKRQPAPIRTATGWSPAEAVGGRFTMLADDEDALEPAPASAEPRLLIAREGQPEVGLVLAADRVVGRVRGTPVDLTIEGGQLRGTLGRRNVWLWLRGHEASGEIGGVPVRFELVETRDGHQLREGFSVRSSLPYGATRVETTATSLSWSGCGKPLGAIAGGYGGRCASGAESRVAIPPRWQQLPALPRLILLSLFLTERDPAMAPLFGAGQ